MTEIARIIQRHELGQRNDYNDMHAMVAEMGRLRRILVRVNALNDSPSHFCKEVDDLTIEFVRSQLMPQEMHRSDAHLRYLPVLSRDRS